MGLVYSASLRQPENCHGTIIPICRSLPRNVSQEVKDRAVINHPLRKLLMPSKELLQGYKAQEKLYSKAVKHWQGKGYTDPTSYLCHLQVCGSWQKALETPEPDLPERPDLWYIRGYREQIGKDLSYVREQLGLLCIKAKEEDRSHTLTCWEPAGEFCHRNLVMQCIVRWFPESYGGCDVPVDVLVNSGP